MLAEELASWPNLEVLTDALKMFVRVDCFVFIVYRVLNLIEFHFVVLFHGVFKFSMTCVKWNNGSS